MEKLGPGGTKHTTSDDSGSDTFALADLGISSKQAWECPGATQAPPRAGLAAKCARRAARTERCAVRACGFRPSADAEFGGI
jgi:hypothetical protein